ncbi:MAG TPA: amino acid adenylation domain-containing protein, partial [Solirubrobacteraceae bacterium]|nr:amino acid adenylation domain-containing protein [Solirubrobacteraceae bacterium]
MSDPAGGTPLEPVHALVARHAAGAPDALAVAGAGATASAPAEPSAAAGATAPAEPSAAAGAPVPAARAARREAAAVAAGGCASLTYGALDAAAGAIASALRARGVGPEVPVGVCVERSPELLVALLGVLRAGGAALLLDPAWPRARVDQALAAVGPAAVLERADVAAALRDAGPAAPPAPVHLDMLACIVQTSGSTGEPKSVGVTHRALAHRAATHRAGRRLGPSDRASWLTPPGASASAAEIWPALAAGASLHVPDPSAAASPAELRDWMVAERITQAFVGMPLAEALYRLPWDRGAALRLMTVGGDTVRAWAPRDLPFEVAVEYGSAEANGVTSALVPWRRRCTSRTASAADRAARPPIGRPWPGVRTAVVEGELHVAGPELARGYLGGPRATADRFIPDPAGPPGTRRYRTGDMVTARADGLLEHHGRVDAQVKVRGERVEPAEVEAALLAHPAVREVAVVPHERPDGDRALTAFVVAGDETTPAALRAFAADRLPAHMVPATVTPLDELPLTASGKVDRARLAADSTSPPSDSPPPRSASRTPDGPERHTPPPAAPAPPPA